MSEMAIVSSRRVRLARQAGQGDAGAQAALKLADAPNNFLSTVQIGITVIGIVAGAFGGARISEMLGEQIARVAALAPYSKALGFGIVVAVITFFSLVVGELVPKRLALIGPERVACLIARPMTWLSRMASPAVRVLSFATDLIVKILGVKPSGEPAVTEDEIHVMLDQAKDAGVVEKAEHQMVRNVFRFGDESISQLMTPRSNMVWLDIQDPDDENKRKLSNGDYSYLPVCDGGPDKVVGMVALKRLFPALAQGKTLDIKAHMDAPLFVPDTSKGQKLLELFKQSKSHTAVVVNEYGSIQGLVTIADVLEAIVGDMPTPDPEDPDVVRRADGSWLMDGLVSTARLKEILGLKELPSEAAGSYETLSGLMMTQLNRMPRVTDQFTWKEYRFEVVDMDGHRVDKVLVTAVKSPDSGEKR